MEYQSSSTSEKKVFTTIIILSLSVLAFLIWLIYFKPGATPLPEEVGWVNSLSSLNALLNSLTSIFLIAGIILVKRNQLVWHKRAMIAATATSAIFLISYITYHHFHGDTKFIAQGTVRYFYFFTLITHIVLSAVQVPLILSTLYLAFTKKFEKHKKFARITFPIWLYVSITGVVIYIFLKWFNV